MRVRMGYPDEAEDELIMERFAQGNPIVELTSVVSAELLLELQRACREVMVDADVRQYIIKLVHATREHPQVELGASPRAMLGMLHTAQALAAIRGREYVIPDDVKQLAPYVLEHRIITHTQSHLRGHTASDILCEVLDSVPVPVEEEEAADTDSGV